MHFNLETFIPDIAIEHRKYIYSQDQTSSITCRSKLDLYPIQPIDIDHGCIIVIFTKKIYSFVFIRGKHWAENRLKYFTFPRNLTRNQALQFCLNNNGTLMYWTNSTEQEILQG